MSAAVNKPPLMPVMKIRVTRPQNFKFGLQLEDIERLINRCDVQVYYLRHELSYFIVIERVKINKYFIKKAHDIHILLIIMKIIKCDN